VLWVYQLESDFKQKRTSLVEVQRLNDDGTPDENYPYPYTITAPQIYATWEEHVVEQERHEEKKRLREQEEKERWERIRVQQEERAERRRKEQAERQRVENERREKVYAAFESVGIPRNLILFSYDGVHINIKTWDLEGVIDNIKSIIQSRDSEDYDSGQNRRESQAEQLANSEGS